jgi:thiol-disulfide isomerase/thioredoxin
MSRLRTVALPPLSRAFLQMLAAVAALSLTACATSAASSVAASAGHGRLTELSREEGPIVLCEHKVPEAVCTRHHPELVAQFKRAGDWCAPHGVPESQCLECHPDLTFDPLPNLPPDADVVWLSKQGEDVASLESHVVPGKVTVFDFYADWCAACRKVDGHVFKRLASGDRSIAYRKVNIVTWETPVAARYLTEVPGLPLIVVFGRDGKRVASLHGADLDALDKAIAAATGK